MTVTVRRKPRDQALLHRAAAPLKPTRLPYYVQAATEPGQGVGWFWVPAGASEPQLLGANVYMAHLFLLRVKVT